MPAVPPEFTAEAVRRESPKEARLFWDYYSSAEPQKSLERLGLTFRKDLASPTHLNDDDSHYYNTLGSAAEYWRGKDLPRPTKDIRRMRSDIAQWGYCLVQDALSPEQLKHMQQRVAEQAAAERRAGLAQYLNASAAGSTSQFVCNIVNKGRCFEQCLEFSPEGVQAGPLMEQLLSEALGGPFLISSFTALMAAKDGYPQALHQDQPEIQTAEAPLLFSAIYLLDDVGPANGGTLVVPGSHRLLSDAGSRRPVYEMPPAINVTAPAGSVMLFDGRLLHGTGVNRTDAPRTILISSYIKAWMRTQEIWALSLAPDVLQRASPRLLQRLGFMANTMGTVEGHGLGGSGRPGDEFSSIVEFRRALDEGRYERVRSLSAESSREDLFRDYTYRSTASGRRSIAKAEKFGLLAPEDLREAKRLSFPGGMVGRGYTKRGSGNNALHSRL